VAESEEYRALDAIGVPVPRWARLLPGKPPQLDGFGPYLVTKPDFGARGAEVRIERRDDAKWKPPRTTLSQQFGGPWNPRVAQEFVYTGGWPRSHRDVLSLAERAHAAVPRVPLLGVDILRDADTGELFVVELNGLGYTWDFSSPTGLSLQAQFGFNLEAQLGGRRRAAGVLARVCAEHCR